MATGMTAILAGSLYATLHVSFKARRSAHAAVEQVRKVELAIELVRGDVESALVPRGIMAGIFVGEDATDAAGRPSDSLMLHCTADAAQETDGLGDVRMIELSCEPDEDGPGMVLLRRVNVHLLATNVETPDDEVLCRGVRLFDLRYFDGLEWQDEWDSTMQDSVLPIAVEVTLALVSEDGTSDEDMGYWSSRIFRLACSSLTPGLQVEVTAK